MTTKPLDQCSRTHNIDGSPCEEGEPSEWAVMYALGQLVDQEYTEEELNDTILAAMILQACLEMEDVELHFDGELTVGLE